MTRKQTVMVVGASRGLGLALAEEYCRRGWHVIATARSSAPPLAALAARYPGSLERESVDITDPVEIDALRSRLEGRSIDLLFVNAGICIARDNTPLDVETTDFVTLMVTNALSPMRVVEALEPLVPVSGAIAVMSSGLGSITQNNGFWELYSASKAALNMLMKCFAGRHHADPRALLLVAPGWIRTEMGGSGATYSIEESIPPVVDAVDRQRGTPGLRFIDRTGKVLPW